MKKFSELHEAKTANGKSLKKGDKVRVNRQGAKPEKVLSVNGTTVYTYENPNSSTHITKLVKIEETMTIGPKQKKAYLLMVKVQKELDALPLNDPKRHQLKKIYDRRRKAYEKIK